MRTTARLSISLTQDRAKLARARAKSEEMTMSRYISKLINADAKKLEITVRNNGEGK